MTSLRQRILLGLATFSTTSSTPWGVLAVEKPYSHSSPLRDDFIQFVQGGRDPLQLKQIPKELWSELNTDMGNNPTDDRFSRDRWTTHLEKVDLEVITYSINRPIRFWLELGSFRGSSCIRSAQYLKDNEEFQGSAHFREYKNEVNLRRRTRPFENPVDAEKFFIVCVDGFVYGSSFIQKLVQDLSAQKKIREKKSSPGGKGRGIPVSVVKREAAPVKAAAVKVKIESPSRSASSSLSNHQLESTQQSIYDRPSINFNYQCTREKEYQSANCVETAGFGEHTDDIKSKDDRPLLDHLFYKDGSPKLFDQFILNVRFAGLQNVIAVWPQTTVSAMRLLQDATVDTRTLKNRREPGRPIGSSTSSEHSVGQLEQPDVIYLDSAHLRDETLMELLQAWTLLKPGGMMFGDDWIMREVHVDVLKFVELLNLPLYEEAGNWEEEGQKSSLMMLEEKRKKEKESHKEKPEPSESAERDSGFFFPSELLDSVTNSEEDRKRTPHNWKKTDLPATWWHLANRTQTAGELDLDWFPHNFYKHKVGIIRPGLFVSRSTFQWFIKKKEHSADLWRERKSAKQDHSCYRDDGGSTFYYPIISPVSRQPPAYKELTLASPVGRVEVRKSDIYEHDYRDMQDRDALENKYRHVSKLYTPFRPAVRQLWQEGSSAYFDQGLRADSSLLLYQQSCFLAMDPMQAKWFRRECCEAMSETDSLLQLEGGDGFSHSNEDYQRQDSQHNEATQCWDILFRKEICCSPALIGTRKALNNLGMKAIRVTVDSIR